MRINEIIESIELSFDNYSEVIRVQGHDDVKCNGRYLSFDASTPFDLYDYPFYTGEGYWEIDYMKGTIDRTITICVESIDIMSGQVIARIISDVFQAAEITECSDSKYSLTDINKDVNESFADGDLLHGEEGLEVKVNIAKEFILE